jgi:uncharacterized protein (TIGR02271 family)
MAETKVATGTIAAYFDDSSDARQAVDALKEAGFQSAHLGIAHRGSYTGTSSTYGNSTVYDTTERAEPSTWDKIKGWFSGDSTQSSTSDRSDYDVVNRSDVGKPADYIDEGYDDTSDLHGSFTAMNIPPERARYFAHRFGRGTNSAVVTVQAGGRITEAESILLRYNGDLGESAATYDYTSSESAYDYPSSESEGTATATGELTHDRDSLEDLRRTGSPRTVQLLGEVLRVHKDRVNRGEARIRKEVVTENQSVQVPVQREELVVERRRVDGERPASGTPRNEEIRIPLSEEQARVAKSTVVREEVSIGKKPVEQVRDLNSDVRHEELVVDDDTKKERSA